MDIKYKAKRFIVRSPTLYSIAHCLTGKPIHSIVTDKTIMCLEGYPRSANTYALNLVRAVLVKYYPVFFATHSEHLIAHHTHRIANVEAAHKRGIPTLVLLRAPSDAVTSGIVKRLEGSKGNPSVVIRRLIHRYIDFYEYVKDCNGVSVIKFDTVINNSRLFIKFVLNVLELEEPDNLDMKQITGFAQEAINYWGREEQNLDRLSSNFPDEKKENSKKEVLNKIKDSYNEDFKRAKKLFKMINERSSV